MSTLISQLNHPLAVLVMPQQAVPPSSSYHSSDHVLDGISLAISTLNNPRGLECLWNGPYCQTFSELLRSYQDEKFLVYSPYTLWMPAYIKKEEKLKKHFEESGLEYDIVPRKITREYLREVAHKVQARRQQLSPNVAKARPTAERQSARIKQKKEEAPVAEVKKLKKQLKELFKQRLKIIEEHDKMVESKNHFLKPFIFINWRVYRAELQARKQYL